MCELTLLGEVCGPGARTCGLASGVWNVCSCCQLLSAHEQGTGPPCTDLPGPGKSAERVLEFFIGRVPVPHMGRAQAALGLLAEGAGPSASLSAPSSHGLLLCRTSPRCGLWCGLGGGAVFVRISQIR